MRRKPAAVMGRRESHERAEHTFRRQSLASGCPLSGPRNPKAHARGQRIRSEIRLILKSHNPLLPPLTAKDVQARLTARPLLSLRTLQWHIAAIRTEAIIAEVDTLRSAQFIP
jgi:hypothetical protein